MGDARREAEHQCGRLLRQRQMRDRVPGLVGGVVRNGGLSWSLGLGMADPARPDFAPDADTQFQIASVTKSFTATLVLQLRDEGRLDLDDTLERHLPGTPHGGLEIRRLLSHLSGLEREPDGPLWRRTDVPVAVKLADGLAEVSAVKAPGREWHYSNIAYGLLGKMIERILATSWNQAIAERLMHPLGMTRTAVTPDAPAAVGLLVDPYADRVTPDAGDPRRLLDPAGGLWSTIADLARWAAFLADPDPTVLAPATVEEMTQPQVLVDPDTWTRGWGLGLELIRDAGRVLVGHSGGVPGFRAGLLVDRAADVGAIVLANTSAGTDPTGLAADLIDTTLTVDPPDPPIWRPGPPVPERLEGLLGPWWSEARQWTFHYRAGRLEAHAVSPSGRTATAVFEPRGDDELLTVSGYEAGERLRITRDEGGIPVLLHWATYRFTRSLEPFRHD